MVAKQRTWRETGFAIDRSTLPAKGSMEVIPNWREKEQGCHFSLFIHHPVVLLRGTCRTEETQ